MTVQTSSLHPATLRSLETLSTRLTQQAAAAPGRSFVAIGAIQPGRHQPRTHFDQEALEGLATSIRAHGIIEPLILNRLPEGMYELVAGERRWRAAQLAGLSEVPADVRDYQDDDKLADHAFVSNLEREGLSLADEVREVARIVARHGDLKTATEKFGKSVAWFSKRSRLAEAPDFILAFMETGRSRDVDGLYELALLAKDDSARARQLLESYVAANGTGPALRHVVRATQAAEPSRPRRRAAAPRPVANEPGPALGGIPPDSSNGSRDVGETPAAKTPTAATPTRQLRPAPSAQDAGEDAAPLRRPVPVTPLELSVSGVHVEAQVLVLETQMGVIHCRLTVEARSLLTECILELQL